MNKIKLKSRRKLRVNIYQYLRQEEQSNELLYLDTHSKYRANDDARKMGMKEFNGDYKKRKRDTESYCTYIGRSYEDILKFGL